MRTIAFLLALSACAMSTSISTAGELFDTSQWKNASPTASGSVPFTDLVSYGYADPGATIAHVDLFGTAKSLSVYTGVHETADIRNVLATDISSVAWLREVATSSAGQAIDGGWTRFDFRSLKLLVTSLGVSGPNFAGGRGPFFEAQGGVFSAVAGLEQHASVPGPDDIVYFEPPSTIPSGPVPVFRVIWESLDPPYVSPTGDANRDGRVDLSDFGVLKASFHKTVDRWTVADFTGDGLVDANDFETLLNHFGQPGSAALPEPTSATILLVGAGMLMILRLQKPI